MHCDRVFLTAFIGTLHKYVKNFYCKGRNTKK